MDVHVSLVGRKNLAGEIYQQLRGAIVEGRLRPGDRLPPSRELALRLSVSRSTVTVAYDRLGGEGFVTSRLGDGTFVSDAVPNRADMPKRTGDGSLRPRRTWDNIPVSTAFAAPADFEFRTGVPDSRRFPFETWRRLMARELRASAVGRGYETRPVIPTCATPSSATSAFRAA